MCQQQTLYHWCRCVSKQFPTLSKPQAWVLAAFSLAVALSHRCALPAAAEALPGWGKPDSLERRWQRFLSNSHVDWSRGCTALAGWVIGSLAPTRRVVLLVDETSLRQKLKVMAVSLAYRGRALPLAWWCWIPGRAEGWWTLRTTSAETSARLPLDCSVCVRCAM